MFESSNYFTVFLPYAGERLPIIPSDNNCWCWLPFSSCPAISTSGSKAGGGTNSRKQLIEQCNQCQKLPEPVHDRLQLPVQCTAAEYWQQKLVANPQCATVPLVTQDVISAPASQAFVERLFSVCGLLTQGTRNRMDKKFVRESVAKSEL